MTDLLTAVDLASIPYLDPPLVLRAVTFAARVAELNRNRNYLGEPPAPVALITDELTRVPLVRTDAKLSMNPTTVGMCWAGSSYWGPTVIWLAARGTDGHCRGYENHVETLIHELAHSQTSDKHGHTFRRMYALLAPHILELFDSAWAPDPLWHTKIDRIIYRYQRGGLTLRRIDNNSAYHDYVDAYERRQMERRQHIRAAIRMRDRLARHHITP